MKLSALTAKLLIPFVTVALTIPVMYYLVRHNVIPLPQNAPAIQYLILNKSGGGTASETCCPWNWQTPDQITEGAVDEIIQKVGVVPSATNKYLGIGIIIPYLESPCPSDICNGNDVQTIQKVLDISLKKDMPVLIKLDGFSWWETRPDLWNWWDPTKPGYNPENINNVEWTSWDASSSATKIAWRNWGHQIRVKPHPNLGSLTYIAEKKHKLKQLLPIIKNWFVNLPPAKKYLFAGVVLDNELSVGVNFTYYPHGNDYLNQPIAQDPFHYLDPNAGLSFGFEQLGYAAVKSYGIKSFGTLTASDLNEVIKRHSEMLAQTAADAGLPKDKVFVHGLGNITPNNPDLFSYGSIINQNSTAGWSMYEYANNPSLAPGLSKTLIQTDQPWGAVEWLPTKAQSEQDWQQALENTLNFKNNKLVALYNWEGMSTNQNALQAIRNVLGITTTPIPTQILTPTNPPATPTQIYLSEDINRDGCVGLLDFNSWFQAIKNGIPQPGTKPDINNDGLTDIVDFNLWFRAMKNLSPDKLC